MRARLAVLALALAASLAAMPAFSGRAARQAGDRPAATSTVRGRVEIRRPLPPVDQRPALTAMPPTAAEDPAQPRLAVVYFENAPQPAFEEREILRARMNQRNEAFVPHVLAIPVGTVVDFPNNDVTFHNVFSLSKAKRFDLGRYPAGRSRPVLFDQPGIVRVFCEIHSQMNAFILVFGHRYFAVTDADGRYRIDRVPPGTYNVTAWYEGVAQDTRTVTVPASGGTLDLDFVLR